MKHPMRLLLALTVWAALPLAAAGQSTDDADAATARYEAAIAWANLVLVDNDFEAAAQQANEAAAAQITAAVLQKASVQLYEQLGALQSLEPKDQTMSQGFRVVILTGVFETGTANVQVFMADDHSIAGFSVRSEGA